MEQNQKLINAIRFLLEKLTQAGIDFDKKSIIIKDGVLTVK